MQITRLTSAQSPDQKDFDMDITGWGPDFQDPSTYLNILNPTDGSTLTGMGLDPKKVKRSSRKLVWINTKNC